MVPATLQPRRPRTARRPRFERELLARARELVPPGERAIVVGASGGPDSTALLLGLAAVARSLGVESVVAAHLDHGLRGEEGRADRDFVLALATRLGCRFEEGRASELEAAARGIGLEAAARETRYAFLLDTAERAGASVVAVAHTRQDQAETVLLRILRGAGLRGLSAMAPARRLARGSPVLLVRPLLGLSRGDVLEYLALQGVEARQDSMNSDRRFARARVRHDLLPRVSELNPRAEEALARVAEAARGARAVVEREARRLLRSARPAPGEAGPLALGPLERAPEAVLEVALARVLRSLGPERLSRLHVRALVKLVRSPGARGPVALPGGIAAWKERGALRLGPAPAAAPASRGEAVALRVPGRTLDPESGLTFEARVVAAADLTLSNEGDRGLVARFDLALAQGPLAVRRRRAGDRFVPLGSSGTTTLKRFFIDRKIPREERARVPVVTLEDRPVWVVGERQDDRLKVTPATRDVLELRADPARAGDLLD